MSDDKKVTALPVQGRPFMSRTWLLEKVDATVEGLADASDELRKDGGSAEVLRPALWNALKVAAGIYGREDLFSPELVATILERGHAAFVEWKNQAGNG